MNKLTQKLLDFEERYIDKKYDEFELLETEDVPFGAPLPRLEEQKARGGIETVAAQGNITDTTTFTGNLDVDIALFSGALGLPDNKDTIVRRFNVYGMTRACAFYVSGMADADRINDFILRQSMGEPKSTGNISMKYFCENVACIAEHKQSELVADCTYDVISGMTAVLIENHKGAVVFETRGFAHRSIEQPKIEKVVIGPHESFVEAMRTNITMMRRIVKTSDMVCDFMQMGGNNNVTCSLMYRNGIVNKKLLALVKKKIGDIKTEFILGQGMLELLTEGSRYSLIPQSLITERPDRASSLLMQGHIVILCEGSPFAQVVPVTIATLMSSPDDDYSRKPFVAISKATRYFGMFISILLPALYVALVKYHQGLISTDLINTILVSRRMVSFPVEVELLLLLTVFQLVRESGLHVPGEMGQSLSVIAALVLGQASVSANFTSSVMLILVAVAGLGNYAIPDYRMQFAANNLQIILIIGASLAGFLGISLIAVAVAGHLFSLKSFGVPMCTPFSPKAFGKKEKPQDVLNTQRS